MKYRSLLLFSGVLLLASCLKYIHVDNSVRYTIHGFQDVAIDQNDSGILFLYFQLLSGDPTNEYITVKLNGIPDSVTVNHDSLTFRPNYGYSLVFYGHSPQPGVYPITATVTAPSIGAKIFTFNLTVTSLTDCTRNSAKSQIASPDNRHQVTMSGNFGSYLYAYVQRAGCDTLHISVMKDSMELGSEPNGVQYVVADFSAFVDCSANAVSVFPQNLKSWILQPGEMIRGSGTFAPVTTTTATITLNDTLFTGSQVNSTTVMTIY